MICTAITLLTLNLVPWVLASPSSIAARITEEHTATTQTIDFGSVSALRSAPVSRIFVLSNNDSHSMTVSDLRSACGCTSALTAHNAVLPLVLLPGQQITVQVTLDPANLPPGPVSKSVWVYVKGRNTTVATLTLIGTLVPAARLAPASLDFGQAASGSGPTVLLAVAWNGAALPPGSRCRLVSTNPDVSVTPAPAPAGASGETYLCTLSSWAPLGELEGSIQAVVTPPGEEPVVVGEAPLRGDVRGDVAATPAVVAFGTVPAGKSAPRRIELTLARAETPSVSSASPYLTARLGPITSRQPDHPFGAGPLKTSDHSASGEPKPFRAGLDVTLSGEAHAGPLATELTVTTGSGQRLRVPVFALIVPAEAKR